MYEIYYSLTGILSAKLTILLGYSNSSETIMRKDSVWLVLRNIFFLVIKISLVRFILIHERKIEHCGEELRNFGINMVKNKII